MLRQQHVMSSLRACGQAIPLRAARHPLPPLRRAAPPRTWTGVIARRATTTARQPNKSLYRYPPEINIYRHGTFMTTGLGILRVSTYVLAAFGSGVMFPAYLYRYFFPSAADAERGQKPVPWWMPPALLVGSWVPLLAAFFAFAPWVHQIHVRPPLLARKSREELLRWAANVPRQTPFFISVIRLRPWPTTQLATFEDMARLPKFTTNLEVRPPDHDNYLGDNAGSRWAVLKENMARRALGRFYVSRTQSSDKSGVPGVWDKIWPQIPMEVEKRQTKIAAEQKKAQAKAPGPRIRPTRPRR